MKETALTANGQAIDQPEGLATGTAQLMSSSELKWLQQEKLRNYHLHSLARETKLVSMNGFVFISAILATWLIVGVIVVGRSLQRKELETGIEPKGSDAFIFGCCAVVLGGLYFSSAHPVIAYTLAIVTGFAAALGFLLVGGLIVRALRVALQR